MLDIDEVGDDPKLQLDRVEDENMLELDEGEDEAKLKLETVGDEETLKLNEAKDEPKIELDGVEDETELWLENTEETPLKLKEAETKLLELLDPKCGVLALDAIELKAEIVNELSKTDEADADDVLAIMKELVIEDELAVEDKLVQDMEPVELNTNEDMVRPIEGEELSTMEELVDENGTMVFDSNETDILVEEDSGLEEETPMDEEIGVFHVDTVATLLVTDWVDEYV